MNRISKIPLDKWDPGFRAVTKSQHGIMPVLAHTPAIGIAVVGLYAALGASRTLPKRLLELVRLRIGYQNQCRTCIAVRFESDGLPDADDGAICALENPLDSEVLEPAEKAAISYADLMATDHMSMDDDTYEALREHFLECQIVELGVHVATLIGFGRLTASLQLIDHLPADYRESPLDRVTPWTNSRLPISR